MLTLWRLNREFELLVARAQLLLSDDSVDPFDVLVVLHGVRRGAEVGVAHVVVLLPAVLATALVGDRLAVGREVRVVECGQILRR